MFYEVQPQKNKEQYKDMLKKMGQLSNLFSASECPYLSYRVHENTFCKYLEAENLARFDCSADAKKGKIGIGLKTWTGGNDQKIAEFGRLKKEYSGLTGLELVLKISEYRNERIRVTKKLHKIDTMIYHIVKRSPQAMQIFECAFDYIDIDNIRIIEGKGKNNNTYFTDNKHIYHFSVSKNTLYMVFDDMDLLDTFDVPIIEDPYTLLSKALSYMSEGRRDKYKTSSMYMHDGTEAEHVQVIGKSYKQQLCLPLYAIDKDGEKYVPEKSGLNQWNAGGRKRDHDEIYIPYLKKDRERDLNFFPERDKAFNLHMPDGSEISAKVCQAAYKKVTEEELNLMPTKEAELERKRQLIGKSIMSNPNKVLGKWLLRDVFEVPEGQLITYDMLDKFGIDSVVFTKNSNLDYSIDFAEIGTYERFYGESDDNAEEEME